MTCRLWSSSPVKRSVRHGLARREVAAVAALPEGHEVAVGAVELHGERVLRRQHRRRGDRHRGRVARLGRRRGRRRRRRPGRRVEGAVHDRQGRRAAHEAVGVLDDLDPVLRRRLGADRRAVRRPVARPHARVGLAARAEDLDDGVRRRLDEHDVELEVEDERAVLRLLAALAQEVVLRGDGGRGGGEVDAGVRARAAGLGDVARALDELDLGPGGLLEVERAVRPVAVLGRARVRIWKGRRSAVGAAVGHMVGLGVGRASGPRSARASATRSATRRVRRRRGPGHARRPRRGVEGHDAEGARREGRRAGAELAAVVDDAHDEVEPVPSRGAPSISAGIVTG